MLGRTMDTPAAPSLIQSALRMLRRTALLLGLYQAVREFIRQGGHQSAK